VLDDEASGQDEEYLVLVVVLVPVEFAALEDPEPDGSLDLVKVEAKIKPIDFHHPLTRLLCLENTQGGKVLSLDYQTRASEFARRKGLALHLDGARIFNAAVKLGVDVREIAKHYDTVSVCLSKGLGAPIGSLLCGPADFVKRARRWRKVLGGGMRQAGIVAAGGIYALEHNVARLAEDHENAAFLAKELSGLEGVEVLPHSGETNMVFLRFVARGTVPAADTSALAASLKARGILVNDRNPLRIVTHLDVDRAAAKALVEGIRSFLGTTA